mmetsp:Transcript_3484/g.5129  ORF Transcript_3484/g.5129 Transcript_3484/m.5129 type:complete len:93 (+) Transcript_3484:544-822(+)
MGFSNRYTARTSVHFVCLYMHHMCSDISKTALMQEVPCRKAQKPSGQTRFDGFGFKTMQQRSAFRCVTCQANRSSTPLWCGFFELSMALSWL